MDIPKPSENGDTTSNIVINTSLIVAKSISRSEEDKSTNYRLPYEFSKETRKKFSDLTDLITLQDQ